MSTEPITTLVLAAGSSRRFGPGVPKQFRTFPHAGRPAQMWENAIQTLSNARVHLVMARSHLPHLMPQERVAAEVIELDDSAGQADTVFQAITTLMEGFSRRFEDVLVVNCDQGFVNGYLDELVAMGRRHAQAVAAVARIEDPSYADETRYSWVDGVPLFQRAYEKHFPPGRGGPLNAMVGAYYFPSAAMLRLQTGLLTRAIQSRGEPYLSMIYAHMEGDKRAHVVPRWFDWGTPETLEKYFYTMFGPTHRFKELCQ